TDDHPPASVVQLHLHCLRSHEPSFATDQFRAGDFEAIDMKPNLTLHHFSLAVKHAPHVRGYGPSLDAVLGAMPGEPIRFRAGNYVLAGQPRDVRPRSTDIFASADRRAATR